MTHAKIMMKLAAIIALGFISTDALAANAGMPWESWIDQVTRSVQGPVLKGAALVAMTLAGIGIANDSNGPVMQKVSKIGFGISGAAAATQWGLPLLGFGNAMVF